MSIIFLTSLYFSNYYGMNSDLYFAMKEGNLVKCKQLVEEKSIDIARESLLLVSSLEFERRDFARYLISEGVNVNEKRYFDGRTPLHYAALRCYFDIVKLLIDKDVNVNETDSFGGTPLQLVVRGSNFTTSYLARKRAIVKLLIEKKANIEIANNNGFTAIMFAARVGLISIVQYLLQAGAKVNKVNNKGRSALHYAVLHDKPKTASLLLNNGADIDIKTNQGETVIDMAASKKNSVLVNLLISHIITDAIKNDNIEKIISLIKKYTELVLKFKNQQEETLLHITIASGSEDMIKNILVLTYGLASKKNTSGQTPIMLATQKGPEFLDIFMQIIMLKEHLKD